MYSLLVSASLVYSKLTQYGLTINILSHDFSNVQQSQQMSNSQLQRISLGAIRLSLAAKIRRFVFPQIVSLTYRIVSSAIFV